MNSWAVFNVSIQCKRELLPMYARDAMVSFNKVNVFVPPVEPPINK